MELARVIHDYLKTLIWPLMLVGAFLLYEDNIIKQLENREVEFLGFKLGKSIDVFSDTTSAALIELRQIAVSTGADNEVLNKIADIQKNINKELSSVKQQIASPGLLKEQVDSRSQVADIERQGFEAILNKNSRLAIQKFATAEEIWPDYHNVSEIKRLLLEQQATLNSSSSWQQLRDTILEKYSWGMPNDIRVQFKQ